MAAASLPWKEAAALWRQITSYFSPYGEIWPTREPHPEGRDDTSSRQAPRTCSRECEAVVYYQTCCLAQQVASNGFDPTLSVRCCCCCELPGGGGCADHMH